VLHPSPAGGTAQQAPRRSTKTSIGAGSQNDGCQQAPQTRTSCPEPDRAPCAKRTDRIKLQQCTELVKELCQQMSSGNRETPAFPLHAGFAILPCLRAKTVINTLQAESDAVTEPPCEEGKEIVSNLCACARGTKSARGSDQYEHWVGSPAPLTSVPCLPGWVFQAVPLENSKADCLPQFIFFF